MARAPFSRPALIAAASEFDTPEQFATYVWDLYSEQIAPNAVLHTQMAWEMGRDEARRELAD